MFLPPEHCCTVYQNPPDHIPVYGYRAVHYRKGFQVKVGTRVFGYGGFTGSGDVISGGGE